MMRYRCVHNTYHICTRPCCGYVRTTTQHHHPDARTPILPTHNPLVHLCLAIQSRMCVELSELLSVRFVATMARGRIPAASRFSLITCPPRSVLGRRWDDDGTKRRTGRGAGGGGGGGRRGGKGERSRRNKEEYTDTYVSYVKELRTNRTYGRSPNGLHAATLWSSRFTDSGATMIGRTHARAYTHYTHYTHYIHYTILHTLQAALHTRYTHCPTIRSPTSVDTTMASRSGSVMVGPKGSSMVTMLSAMLGLIAWRNRRTRSFRSLRSVQRFKRFNGSTGRRPVGNALVWLLVQLHTFVSFLV